MGRMAYHGRVRVVVEMADGHSVGFSLANCRIDRAADAVDITSLVPPFREFVASPDRLSLEGEVVGTEWKPPPPLCDRLAKAVLDGDRDAAILLADAVKEEWLEQVAVRAVEA